MNTKQVAGGLLAGFGLLAAVVNAWAQHLFFAAFHVARAESLESAGSFDPGPYAAGPEATQLFVGLRVLLWVAILAGFGLVAWGVWEEYAADDGGL